MQHDYVGVRNWSEWTHFFLQFHTLRLSSTDRITTCLSGHGKESKPCAYRLRRWARDFERHDTLPSSVNFVIIVENVEDWRLGTLLDEGIKLTMIMLNWKPRQRTRMRVRTWWKIFWSNYTRMRSWFKPLLGLVNPVFASIVGRETMTMKPKLSGLAKNLREISFLFLEEAFQFSSSVVVVSPADYSISQTIFTIVTKSIRLAQWCRLPFNVSRHQREPRLCRKCIR